MLWNPQRTRRCLRRIVCAPTLALLAAAVTFLCAPSPAPAQQPAASLTLGGAYRQMETRNPRLAGARALSAAVDAGVASASLPPDPRVQLGFMNYALPDLRPMAPLGMLQLQVMQMVPLPGKLSAAGGAARARSDAGHARVDQALWSARVEVADAFYDLYQWNARLDVARGTLALLGDIQQTAQAMYRVGSASQADVLKAQVAVATLAEDTVRMVAERSAAAARLEAPLDSSLAERLGPVTLPSFPAAVPASDSLLALALRAGPDVRATRDELSAAEHERDLAARNVWPDLEVGIQLGRRPGTVGNLMGSVMVGASIPVFAGSRQRQATRAADAMATMRRADVRTAEADTRAAVLTAYADLQRARALSALYRTTILPQAEAAAASALASYRVGRVDFTTVLDNRLAVDRYEQAIHELEAAEGKAWAALEALTARELIDANSTTGAAPGGDR